MTTAPSAHTVAVPSQGTFRLQRDADGVDDLWVIESTLTGQTVATITYWDSDDEWAARAWANAKLLTAAPELLEALKRMLSVFAAFPGGLSVEAYEAEQIALAAVARAETGG